MKILSAMNQEKKNAIKSVVFYVSAILIIVAIDASEKFKSGLCTPNLDILSVYIFVILNIILLIINVFKAFVLKKQTQSSSIIHLIVLLSWIIYFNIN